MDIPTILQNINVYLKGPDLEVLTVSPDGNFAALGGKRGLFTVDLNSPWELLQSFKVKPGILTDFSVLEWNSDKSNPTIASGSAQNFFLWKPDEGRWSSVGQVAGHRRRISDLKWSSIDQGFLCTCSADGFLKVWDVRQPTNVQLVRKSQFPMGAPPSLVRWSKFNSVNLASVHKGQVCVWDMRKTQTPFATIFADTSDLIALDWSPTTKDMLLTASHTTKFKLWSMDKPSESLGSGIATGIIEKAIFTPFGHGVLTSIKNLGTVQLFDVFDTENISVVDTFAFTQKPVTDFCVRIGVEKGSNEYQLVTWTEPESQFRLLAIEPWQLQACHQELSKTQQDVSRRNSGGKAIITEPPIVSVGLTMEGEFDTLKPIPGVEIEEADRLNRTLIVAFKSKLEVVLRLRVTFPSAYPLAPPAFNILMNTTGIPDERLKEEVVSLADDYIHGRNMNCVEPCVKLIAKKYIQDPLFNNLLIMESPMSISASPSHLSSSPKPKFALVEKLKELGPQYEIYIVQSGNTLPGIALMFNMDKSELRQLNGIHHSIELYPGRTLIVKSRKDEESTAESNNKITTPRKTSKSDNNGDGVNIVITDPLETAEKVKRDHTILATKSFNSTHTHSSTTQTSSQRTPSTKEVSSSLLVATRPRGNSVGIWRKEKPIDSATSLDSTISSTNTTNKTISSASRISTDQLSTHTTAATERSILGLHLDQPRNIIKFKVKYLPLTHKNSDVFVRGILTVTRDHVIFEPRLGEPLVVEQGVRTYTVVIEVSKILECVSTKIPFPIKTSNEKSAGNSQPQDSPSPANPSNEGENTAGNPQPPESISPPPTSPSNEGENSDGNSVELTVVQSTVEQVQSTNSGEIEQTTQSGTESTKSLLAVGTNKFVARSILMLGCEENEKSKKAKIYHFLGKTSKMLTVCRTMEEYTTAKRERNLLSSLDLDIRNSMDHHEIHTTSSQDTKSSLSSFFFGSSEISSEPTSTIFGKKTKKSPKQQRPRLDRVARRISEEEFRAKKSEKTSTQKKSGAKIEENEETEDGNGDEKTEIPGEYSKQDEQEEDYGTMIGQSALVSPVEFLKIRASLPIRLRNSDWTLIFNTSEHGTSLTTFFKAASTCAYSLVFIKDSAGYVFGGFSTETWEPLGSFFGSGECFVFTVKPTVACYKWTSSNDFYVYSSKEYIAMGGGRHAFYLDADFSWGTSEVSQTYLNRRLSSTEEFSCTVVEVWGIVDRDPMY